jgi:hypothetical protein
VARIVPASPTAKQAFVPGQLTPSSALVVPEVCALHETPPFVVARIVPASPTAKQAFVLGQLMPEMLCVVPDACGIQALPALVVATMSGPPAATHVFTVGQLTVLRPRPSGRN